MLSAAVPGNKQNSKVSRKQGKQPQSKEYLPLKLSQPLILNAVCPTKYITTADEMYVFVQCGKDATVNLIDGTQFQGKILNGVFHGQGSIKWPNGNNYSGCFKANKPHGKGRFTFPGGYYEGEVENGLRHGYGCLQTQEFSYQGQWKLGKMQGQGSINFKDQQTYQGQFKNGLKHGKGKYIYQDGCVYEGDWRHNERQGQGQLVTTEFIYNGDWVKDKPDGWGTITWDLGTECLPNTYFRNRYEGHVIGQSRQGYGGYFFANSSIYIGMWKDNLKEGPGFYIDENGNLVVGQYKRDRLVEALNKESYSPQNISQNFYNQILDLSDLMSADTAHLYCAMCLRYNSQLKGWYRNNSSYSDEKTENIMCLQDVWRFVQTYKVLENVKCMAKLNRSFHRGNKSHTIVNTPFESMELLTKWIKTYKDWKNLYFMYQAQSIEQSGLNCSGANIPEQKVNIHDPKRIILFRHFVDILIRASIIKYKSSASPEKFKEMLEEMVAIDIRKTRKRLRADSIGGASMKSNDSFSAPMVVEANQKVIASYFQRFANNNHQRVDTIDVTAPLLPVIEFFAGQSIDDIVKVKIYRYFFGNQEGGAKFHQPLTILEDFELTYPEFKDFYNKWRVKHKIQEYSRDSSRGSITDIRKVEQTPELNIDAGASWRRKRPEAKLLAKRKLIENRKMQEEWKRQEEIRLQQKRIQEEEEQFFKINQLNLQNMENLEDQLENSSNQSDF